jgi:hypothetical protein
MTRATTTTAADGRTTTIPVWLDCDPGHDDAMAIVLAGHSPRLRLVGVSTVASNQSVDKTTRNALDTLDWAGMSSIGKRELRFRRSARVTGVVIISRLYVCLAHRTRTPR